LAPAMYTDWFKNHNPKSGTEVLVTTPKVLVGCLPAAASTISSVNGPVR
jgi:hypothetical protein